MLKNTRKSYGSIAKFFHWIVAILVLAMLTLGYFMATPGFYSLHKLTGLLVLILVAARIIWMLINSQPELNINRYEKILAQSVKVLLYLAILIMPLSGWMMATAFGSAPHIGNLRIAMPGIPLSHSLAKTLMQVHNTTAIILIVLISLHLLGALKHHFIDRNTILVRMLPTCSRKKRQR